METNSYLVALAVLSSLVVFSTMFLIVTHYVGVHFGKVNDVHRQAKANEVFLIGFATFTTISIMLGLWGVWYCWVAWGV